MATVYDVAKYILEVRGPMTAMKLQKLVYYSLAWSLVWDGKPLFNEHIEAWSNGPVCPTLFKAHQGLYSVKADTFKTGDSNNLSRSERATINAVLKRYGNKPAHWLIELSHLEDPWKNARKGIPDDYGTDIEISLDSMANYYSSLLTDDKQKD